VNKTKANSSGVDSANRQLGDSQQRKAAIRIGCAGWNVPRADGEAAGPGTHLERYAQLLNCCEINSSFYRPHKDETWRRWAASVPADFRFSVKVPKAITHEAKLCCGAALLLPFLRQIELLGEKLGPVLIQAPPSLQFEAAIASSFFAMFREHFSGEVVCEPRHTSWFEDEAEELLRRFHIARVAANPARVAAASLVGGWTHPRYFRLHGSPRIYYSEYSDKFLTRLAANIKERVPRATVWCIFDNTASGAAMRNALRLQELCADQPGQLLR
jgi:uncharacterized protein YecE (DUF72 family)